MPKLKGFALNLLTVIVSVALTLIACEIVLRFMPVATAPLVERPTAENPIQRYVANQPYTWSFGWTMTPVVRGRSNAQGFLADYDYDPADPRPLVAVLGDSYIEALRVSFAQSLSGRLQAALGDRGRAYAFAQSGAALSQYVAYAQHACSTYHPERMVVSVVSSDFDESIHADRRRDGLFQLYPRPDGGFDHQLTPLPKLGLAEHVARRSALALYLMRNVGIAGLVAQTRLAARGEGQTGAGPTRIEEGHRVIDWFVDTLPKAACLAPRDIVILVDSPRPEIYDAAMLAAAQTSYFGQMRRHIIDQAKARGFRVVDTEPHFIAAHAADGVRFEYPNDGHWNAHGHGVVAAAVSRALADWPPLAAGINGE